MVRRALAANAPVLVFSALCGGAAYAVFYAHYQQKTEKQVGAGVQTECKGCELTGCAVCGWDRMSLEHAQWCAPRHQARSDEATRTREAAARAARAVSATEDSVIDTRIQH